MSVIPVLTVPDPRLRQQSKPVSVVDEKIKQLIQNMFDTMHAEDGCGLAAIQIGVPLRVLVLDISYKVSNIAPFSMINPVITSSSAEQTIEDEGCLSVPDQYAAIERPSSITLEYLDETGSKQILEASGFLAKAIHHEMDHLNGKLFIDYLSPMKREQYIRKVQRLQKMV